MAKVILVSGGCRSGKSHFALNMALRCPGVRYFIATCPKVDEEMDRRISLHQKERERDQWQTIEEELNIHPVFKTLESQNERVVIVDCLTLWINNWMYRNRMDRNKLTEVEIREKSIELVQSAKHCFPGQVFFVTSEVGLGLVPETQEGRLFRDLLGSTNQIIAAAAEEVYFLVSGIPIKIK